MAGRIGLDIIALCFAERGVPLSSEPERRE